MVGTATLTEPIITALVSEPRIIDRLIAQRAEGVTAFGVAATLAAPEEAACLSGGRGGVATCYSFTGYCRYPDWRWALGLQTVAALERIETFFASCISSPFQRSPSSSCPGRD